MNFKNKVYLAPMANITTSPFRLLCKKFGADVLVTEMISANALTRNNKSTWKLAERSPKESPIGIQLFGGKPDIIVKAGKLVQDKFDFIDFNFGCPAAKVLKQGAGSALLKRKNQVGKIIECLSGLDIPVTAKIRSGFTSKTVNAVEIAQVIEDKGASAVAIHARTTDQGYSGTADWNVIKEIKRNVSIPVIGNGDIFSGEDAKRMKKETNCDSIMVGRGAMGNPFIFREINKGSKPVSLNERIKTLLSISDDLDFINFKVQAMNFMRDFHGCSKARRDISLTKTKGQIGKVLDKVSSLE
jgi:tRNA-dihydrouridine synthase B